MAAEVDFVERGEGPLVILLHSSVSGAGQWRRLMDLLAPEFRVIAVNLIGYGDTPPWHRPRAQTLLDHVKLLDLVLPEQGSFALVGHSLGGTVAMKAAQRFGDRVERLVLIEPNPFPLLAEGGRNEAFAEALALRKCIKEVGGSGDWTGAAAVFADYWTGAGSWAAMPEDRRAKFASALSNNFHEWDAIMGETTSIAEWRAALPARTTLIRAAHTVRSIREIVELMEVECPEWRFVTLEQGDHMAPLTMPKIVNPIIRSALD